MFVTGELPILYITKNIEYGEFNLTFNYSNQPVKISHRFPTTCIIMSGMPLEHDCKTISSTWLQYFHSSLSTYPPEYDLRTVTCIYKLQQKLISFSLSPRASTKPTICSTSELRHHIYCSLLYQNTKNSRSQQRTPHGSIAHGTKRYGLLPNARWRMTPAYNRQIKNTHLPRRQWLIHIYVSRFDTCVSKYISF